MASNSQTINPGGKEEPVPDEEEEEEEESSSEEEEEVEAAVLSRSKRATAGRRLTSLVGKAAEEDQTFWGHDTWEAEGSDNDSFRESDEDSEQRVDTFDSDFDDSEGDDNEEDQALADQQDKELAKQEKKKRGGGKSRLHGLAKAARDMARGVAAGGASSHHHWSGPQGGRIVGHGDNAGIVLNLPPKPTITGTSAAQGTGLGLFAAPGVLVVPAPRSIPYISQPPIAAAAAAPLPGSPKRSTSAASTGSSPRGSPAKSVQLTAPSNTRHVRRATQHSKYSSRFRAARNAPEADGNSSTVAASSSKDAVPPLTTSTTTGGASTSDHHSNKRKLTAAERAGEKRKRHKTDFTQEELLMEAIHTTAPENHIWLLGRKRAAEEMETSEQQGRVGGLHHHGDKKLVDRFSSKRGNLNVLSFFEMDYVPDIFTNNANNNNNQQKLPEPAMCVITGRPAKYRCPRSQMPYADKAAFAELRKRLENGTLNQPNKASKAKPKSNSATAQKAKAVPANNSSKNGSHGVASGAETNRPAKNEKEGTDMASESGTKPEPTKKGVKKKENGAATKRPPVKRKPRPAKAAKPGAKSQATANGASSAKPATKKGLMSADVTSSSTTVAENGTATRSSPQNGKAASTAPGTGAITPTKKSAELPPISSSTPPPTKSSKQTVLFPPSTPITPPNNKNTDSGNGSSPPKAAPSQPAVKSNPLPTGDGLKQPPSTAVDTTLVQTTKSKSIAAATTLPSGGTKAKKLRGKASLPAKPEK